ncbi:cytochrome ubiquinol oxidase subunit I [Fodinicola feengrottensis]|uniref:cytochrome ubiquinol oxidase subunit I n=1 Tax=Fodinicola feengrottensis TaxID=435914 RepID=UPI002442A904|nr:cytochrome ubiquinol oxidase subunit I [Fodinicola feengrottensis]
MYGLLKTSDAISPIPEGQMRLSLIAFSMLFGVLILLNVWLLARAARHGPDSVLLGHPTSTQAPVSLPVTTF